MSIAYIAQSIRNSLSFSGDALRMTSYENDYSVRGNAFHLQKNFTIAIGTTLNILIDYTTYTKVPKGGQGLIFVLPPNYAASDGAVLVTVRRDSDYSGGTEIDVPNVNTVFGGFLQTTITSGATGNDAGTSVLDYLVGSASTNQSSGGGNISGDSAFIRNSKDKTLVQIANNSGEEITFNYSQTFFEI